MTPQKIIIGLIVSLTLCAFLMASLIMFRQEMYKERLPEIGQVMPFSLTDQEGKAFSSKQLSGKVWVADFFFTTCSDICPMMSKNMAALSRTFEKVPSMEFVSFTVNPEFDAPEVLLEYAKKFISGRDNWHFLTGAREELTKIALDSFKLGSIDEPIFHSPHFVLVDRRGYIRGYYEGTKTDDNNRLFKDAAKLIKER